MIVLSRYLLAGLGALGLARHGGQPRLPDQDCTALDH